MRVHLSPVVVRMQARTRHACMHANLFDWSTCACDGRTATGPYCPMRERRQRRRTTTREQQQHLTAAAAARTPKSALSLFSAGDGDGDGAVGVC